MLLNKIKYLKKYYDKIFISEVYETRDRAYQKMMLGIQALQIFLKNL
jgi:hypothetical protein